MVGEEFDKQALHARVVVHDPYPLAARLRCGRLVRDVQQRFFLTIWRVASERDGQPYAKSAPLALDRLDVDGPAHAGDEVLDNAEPQARALFRPGERLVRLPKGLEERAPKAGRDTDTRVAHLEDDLAGLAQANDYAYIALLAEFLRIGQELLGASSAKTGPTLLAIRLTFMST